MDVQLIELQKTDEIEQLKTLRDSGNISESEYIELVEDIVDLQKILGDVQDEQHKILAQKLVDNLKVVAGLL